MEIDLYKMRILTDKECEVMNTKLSNYQKSIGKKLHIIFKKYGEEKISLIRYDLTKFPYILISDFNIPFDCEENDKMKLLNALSEINQVYQD